MYYNATKLGVDVLDQMARNYSTRCPSRRWPVRVFYNILMSNEIYEMITKDLAQKYQSGQVDIIPARHGLY